VELDADGVCRSCRANSARLHDYNYRPSVRFHRVNQEKVCFGVEIELEADDELRESGTEVGEAAASVLSYPGCKNFMYAKRDGSLSKGAEFVTHPFSWEWFVENRNRFVDIFGRMKDQGFEAKRTCGLHIHVSRSPHTSLEEFRVLQLMYENPVDWMKLSTRVSDSYCKFKSEATRPRERVRVARQRDCFGDRYSAINPTTRDTLEWRIWAGTGNIAKFESALALTAGAHMFARSGAVGLKPRMSKFIEFLTNHSVLAPRVADRLALIA
jgi:hypothetical protein